MDLFPRPLLGTSELTLRPYQDDAIARIHEEFDKHQSTLLVFATGAGKTVTFGTLARRYAEQGRRTLILAHREELIAQAVETLDRVGVDAAVEKASRYARAFGEPQVVVATVQTMQGRRLTSWPSDYFDLIITDECFPAGTLVDGKPIESIRIGDMVRSLNHATGLIEGRAVVRMFSSVPRALVRVTLSDGKSIACTPGHPFFVRGRGYLCAASLSAYDMVLDTTQPLSELHHVSHHIGDMHVLRPGIHNRRQAQDRWSEAVRAHLLLSGMRRVLPESVQVQDDGSDESTACLGTDEGTEPHAFRGVEREDAHHAPGDRMEASDTRRKREGTNRAATSLGVPPRMGHGSHRTHGILRARGNGPSIAFQDRHWQSDPESWDRSGRELSRGCQSEGAGPEEGSVPRWTRVDAVEILQSGSDGRFGGLCPNGLVYNLEVEGNHNYFADGVLVHNCHHSTSDSYQRIYRRFPDALHLGVTATADRADDDELGDVFESVAKEYSLWHAIQDGYLCRILYVQCEVDIDLRDIRTTAGDFNLADLEAKIAPLIDTLANAIRQEVGDRRTLIFTPDVGSASAMASALRSLGFKADFASGACKDRAEKVEAFKRGDLQILVNCNLLTEGFDCPEVAAIVLCRPTKSRPLYAQMVGRGTRNAEGKENCLIVDFNYLTRKHDLVIPTELFDTTDADAERDAIAREYVGSASCGPVDLLDAMQRAEIETERRKLARIKVQERNVQYRRVSYDPCSVADVLNIPRRGFEPHTGTPATEKQIATLEKFGIKDAKGLSKRAAMRLLDGIFGRMDRGLATYKQVAHLIANGMLPQHARLLTKQQASDELDRLWGKAKPMPLFKD